MSRLSAWLLVVAFLGPLGPAPAHAQAEPPRPDWIELPFAQKLDLAVLREVTSTPPEQLLATIGRFGIDLRLVRSAAPDTPVNPLLSTLPTAPDELVRQAEFRDSYEGRVLLRGAACCALERDTILIRDTASTYTLLHEFVQSRLLPTDGRLDGEDVELRFAVDFWRLRVYQRRLVADPRRLLDPLWRRDILAAQAAVADRLYKRIQIGQSQEAVVEKLLYRHVDEQSPYFEADRRAQGLFYGEAMIDNAIDLFNSVHDSVVFVKDAVQTLREAIRTGHLEPETHQRLTEQDVLGVEGATRVVELSLARVRDELVQLKLFYTR